MGRGGKPKGKPQGKGKVPQLSSSHSDSPVEEEQLEQDIQQIQEGIVEVGELLREKISQVEGDQRIAFEALLTLTRQTEEIEKQRELEIEQVRQKYQKMFEPFVAQTVAIVQGKGKGNQLLKGAEGLSKQHLSKGVDGIAIKNYWRNVFKSSNLSDFMSDDDVNIAGNISGINMDLDENGVHLNLTFDHCPMFKEKQLKVTVTKDAQGVQVHPISKLSFTQNSQAALFKQLAGQNSEDLGHLFDLLVDFYEEVYPRSLYYYFDIGINPNEGPGGHEDNEDEQDEDQQEEDQSDEDQSEQVNKKPHKKRKPNPPAKPTKPAEPPKKIEKPECKQM